MTAKTLEEEAKEAAIDIAAEVLGPLKLNGNHIEHVAISCALKSYLAAATPRDKEIEEKNAKIGQMVEERASDLSLFKEIGDDYEAETKELRTEIEELRARVNALGGMVPRWVPVAQKIALDIQGWLPIEDQKCGDSERQWLMVPPIPLPGEGG